MRSSSIILLSGGLDSLVALDWGFKNSDVLFGLTFDYGQRAAKNEIKAAERICRQQYDIQHLIVDLPWYRTMTNSALIDATLPLPDLSEPELEDQKKIQQSADAVWIPNRNGVFIHVAASIAEEKLANWLVTGFNKEEAQTFPDNSLGFVEALNASLKYSTKEKITVHSPMGNKTKKEIVELSLENKINLSSIWSCYRGGEKMCGQCESCRRCMRALREGGAHQWLSELF